MIATALEQLTPEEVDRLEIQTRRIGIEITKGNSRLAHRLVEEAIRELSAAKKHNARILDTTLSECGLEVRTLNFLEEHFRAVTIGDALEITPDELASKKQAGPWTAIGLYRSILGHVLPRALRMEEELSETGRCAGKTESW